METDDAFRVDLPVDEAWRVLTDDDRIVGCLPGVELGVSSRGVIHLASAARANANTSVGASPRNPARSGWNNVATKNGWSPCSIARTSPAASNARWRAPQGGSGGIC